jgi:tRNA-intron endonuclease
MQKIIGEIIDDTIIIKKSKDIGRLFNKSRFGKTDKNNYLLLNLIEGFFLFEEEKLKIYENKIELNFEDLLKKSLVKIPNFEIKYIVFRDLRKRGYALEALFNDKIFDYKILKNKNEFNDSKKIYFVSTFSEKDIIDINKMIQYLKEVNKKNGVLWVSIVDEEGDITYYEISIEDIKGKNLQKKYNKTDSLVLKNRVLIFDEISSKKLFKKEFYGKPFVNGLQLSMVESLYLLKKNLLNIKNIDNKEYNDFNLFKNFISLTQPDIVLRFDVYNDLKRRGLIVKTGFKFGTHFRAYSTKPDLTHAEYLIQVTPNNYKSLWSDFSRAIRLAHSVNKEIIFAIHYSEKNILYLKLGRLRP